MSNAAPSRASRSPIEAGHHGRGSRWFAGWLASIAVHAVLSWGAVCVLRPPFRAARPVVHTVEVVAEAVRPRPVRSPGQTGAQLRRIRPRSGDPDPSSERLAADSLRDDRHGGTAAGEGRARPHAEPMAGGDLDDMRFRPYDHIARDSPQRIRTARRAVTPDNRRMTPHPQPTPRLSSGSGRAERRVPRSARRTASGPRRQREQRPNKEQPREPHALPRADDGLQAKRVHTARPTRPSRRTELLSDEPHRGRVASATRRPEVVRHQPRAVTEHRAPRPADRRERAQASTQRVPDVLDIARPADRGDKTGAGAGSAAGRRGDPDGRKRGQPVWLNTPDRRYVSYFRKIYRKIQPLWKFPKELEVRMEQGEVLVEFTLVRSGAIASVRIKRSSGYESFDKNAVNAVRRASPFTPIPPALGTRLKIVAPFEFSNPLIR